MIVETRDKIYIDLINGEWRCIAFKIDRLDSLISTMLINAIVRIQMTDSDGVQNLAIFIKEIYEKVSHFRSLGEKYGFNGFQSLFIVNTKHTTFTQFFHRFLVVYQFSLLFLCRYFFFLQPVTQQISILSSVITICNSFHFSIFLASHTIAPLTSIQ